jgi:hypothetical protein
MAIIEPRLEPPGEPAPLWRRLGWLAVYWLGGVLVLGIVATLLRKAIL